ncbi:MAG: phosphotransferase [Planctomycetales bacterium]|nr:phosphotransferase [Planctomycetales bacterium]
MLEGAVPWIVDWEMARIGDPAYDLAVVSRGNRRLLGVRNGLNVLLDAYLESGGKPISLTDIHVHESFLILHWLNEGWREHS